MTAPQIVTDADPLDVEAGLELLVMVRKYADEITGGNFSYAEQDLAVLAHLARRAAEAGLTDGLHPKVQAKIAEMNVARERALKEISA